MKETFLIFPRWDNTETNTEEGCGLCRAGTVEEGLACVSGCQASSFLSHVFVVVAMTIVSTGQALLRHNHRMRVTMSEESGVTLAAILDPASLGQLARTGVHQAPCPTLLSVEHRFQETK